MSVLAPRRPAAGAVRRADWLRRLLDRRLLVIVAVSYLLLRAVSFLLMSHLAPDQDPAGVPNGIEGDRPDYLDMTRMWDGRWYQEIVEHGYPRDLPRDDSGAVEQNPWAFYPLFPMLTRVLMAITGGSFGLVGSTLALVIGLGAVLVMAVLIRGRLGPLPALATVLVFAAAPPSPVLQMTYTESLAVLLLCCFLLAVDRERWAVAAGVAVLTGLARPVALPLAVVALVAVWLRWRRREERPLPARERLGMLGMLAGCGVAGLIWPTVAWAVTGERGAYTETMASWRAADHLVPLAPMFRNVQVYVGQVTGPILLVVIIALILLAVLGPWARGLGAPMRTWTLAYLGYLAVVLDLGTSVWRYLLLAFPLATIAVGAAGSESCHVAWRRRMVGLRTTVLVLLGLTWQWWWCWELLRTIPPADNPI